MSGVERSALTSEDPTSTVVIDGEYDENTSWGVGRRRLGNTFRHPTLDVSRRSVMSVPLAEQRGVHVFLEYLLSPLVRGIADVFSLVRLALKQDRKRNDRALSGHRPYSNPPVVQHRYVAPIPKVSSNCALPVFPPGRWDAITRSHG